MTDRRFIFVLLFLITLLPCVSAMGNPYRVFLEEPLVSVAQSLIPGSFKISPDGVRYAYIVADKKEQKVILDGQEHPSYQDIANLCFTPDSNHLAYIAKRENKYFLVFDGIEGKGYDSIIISSFLVSADSKHYAFIGKTGDKWLVATETGAGKTYDEISASLLSFSPDSLSLAYTARVGDKWISVINGQESKAYDGIRALLFSPDSKRTAAVVRVGNVFAVLVDGEEGPAFSMVKPDSLVFSPDSQQIGYNVIDQGREFITLNHQAGKAYDQIVSNQISFSSDSSRIAFAAQLQEKQFIVADGVEGPPYAGVMETPPVFSPDGKKIAYAAFTGTHWIVVLDGTEQTGYASIGKGSLQFDNRGSRLAYIAKTGNGAWTVVVDGVAGRYYDDIGHNSLTFSPDGKNVVYSARQGNKWLVVLDNQESRLFDAIVTSGESQIRFNGSAFFYYCALDGQKIVSIQERIASKSDFKDFLRPTAIQSATQIPPEPVPEFKFQFNPPNGLKFIETTKTTDSVEAEMMNQQLHEEEIKIQTEIYKSSSGYQINYSILKYLVNDVEDQAGGEALSALEGVKFTTFLDSNGFITGFNGLEDFDKKLKTIPARHYRKYKEYFAKDTMAGRFKDGWKASVENFIGKSFQLGEVWETSAKIPLPNGEISDVATKIKFKEETVVGSIPCILVQVEYDLNSSNLKKFLSEMIVKGVPQLKTEPEVDISGKGESIIDPKTLLGYSSRMEMAMKALIDMPTLGKKEFAFRRIIDITYEYLN